MGNSTLILNTPGLNLGIVTKQQFVMSQILCLAPEPDLFSAYSVQQEYEPLSREHRRASNRFLTLLCILTDRKASLHKA